MTQDAAPVYDDAWDVPLRNPALAVSTACSSGELRDQLARDAYSYRIVARAFAPLLRRWGAVEEIDRPESRLDFALRRLRQQGKEPLHLGFFPLHQFYVTADAANVAFPFWEFPDVPAADLAGDTRHNWARVANRLTLLLTASTFTREAFRRVGVTRPMHVVPVPIPSEYFDVPAWEPNQSVRLDCPAYIFHDGTPTPDAPPIIADAPALSLPPPPQGMLGWGRHLYKMHVRRRMPGALDHCLTRLSQGGRRAYRRLKALRLPSAARGPAAILATPTPHLDLSGVVYTMIFNPFCPRKNWENVLTAFLLALGDRADATLVLKLAVTPALAAAPANGVIGTYRGLGLKHRSRLVVLSEYLTDTQMIELARASTFHVNASRAEGANLPLQNYLAAGRPGLSPRHTAMTDYFHDELGFVVASHPEPCRWPHDPEQRLATSWHCPVWQSLFDQFRASYDAAKRSRVYHMLAARGREQIEDYARAERVWPRLAGALNAASRRVDVGADLPPCASSPSCPDDVLARSPSRAAS